MLESALGLIETKGLIGAIVATDAAAKASAIVVSSAELTEAAFMTVKIEGELGAVQAAVKAAAAAVEAVGELIAVDIIARPGPGLAAIVLPRRYVSKYHPNDDRPALRVELKAPKQQAPKDSSSVESIGSLAQLEALTVTELRRFARTLKGLSLQGREVSVANKTQLIEAIKTLLRLDR